MLWEVAPRLFTPVEGRQVEQWLIGHDVFNVDLASALEIDLFPFDNHRLNHWGWPTPTPTRKVYPLNSSSAAKLNYAQEVCSTSGGGLLQRITDNHAILDAIKALPPESIAPSDWRCVEGWVENQELFLIDVANALMIDFIDQITIPWNGKHLQSYLIEFGNQPPSQVLCHSS